MTVGAQTNGGQGSSQTARRLLQDTVTLLCKDSLQFKSEITEELLKDLLDDLIIW